MTVPKKESWKFDKVCEACHLFMTPACDEQNCSAFGLLENLVKHLQECNKKGCFVGQMDSRRDAFKYILELLGVYEP